MKTTKLEKLAVNSFLHKPLLDLRSTLEYRRIVTNKNINSHTRAYCISPFKTGTTFLKNAFSEYNQVAHEPFQYMTLNRINNSEFLKMRSSYLNLDLECSGFFSTQYNKILEYNPDAKLISIYRDPSTWIDSVINYFVKIDKYISYNYVLRLFFDEYTIYPIENFFNLNINEQEKVISGLLRLWSTCYTLKTVNDNIFVVRLENLDRSLHELEDYLELKAHTTKNTWKRKNNSKREININDYINNDKYSEITKHVNFLA